MLNVLMILGLVWLVICVIIASFSLKIVTHPYAHTIEDMRKQQTDAEHIDFDEYDNK